MKKALLVLLSAIAITLMLPQRGMLGLSVQRGDVWEDASITAPFDIPITKTIQEIERDRILLNNSYVPIFRLDTIGLANLNSDTLLHHIYTQGVLPETEWERHRWRPIRIVQGTSMRTVPTLEVYSPSSAEARLAKQGVNLQIIPNLTYDEKLNKTAREDMLSNISSTRGVIRTGEVVIAHGQIIDEPAELLLKSYVSQYETRMGGPSTWFWVLLGRFFIVLTVLCVNILFFEQFAQNYFGQAIKPLIFTFMLYLLMTLLVAITSKVETLSPFIVPLPIVAIYLLTFFNMRVAIFGNISVAILCALFVKVPFDYFLVNFIGGMAVIFMLRHFYHRANLFKAVGVALAVELLVTTCLTLLSDATISMQVVYKAGYLLMSVLLLLGFYQAIYLFERIFGFMSDLTLLELSDTNQPTLLNLAQQAPGTFQHSVQVANLAESAAKAIGARPLLARCGALYHDIGKMKNPFYFAENLSGTFNPHNDCTPEQSAEIIRRHVSDGSEMAHAQRLPQQITDFIERHHGNSIIYFFYAKAKASDPSVNAELFRYPGVNPVSKEVSICMMADAVEAASRSLPCYDKEPLEQLVDTIIDQQISEGLLAHSQLSFAEALQIKDLFKTKLNNIYHGRIAYPTRK